MKVLAKTKDGRTLICDRQSFLDSSRYRVIDYSNIVMDWNNRKLIEIKAWLKEEATDDVFKASESVESFLDEYRLKSETEKEKERKEKLRTEIIEAKRAEEVEENKDVERTSRYSSNRRNRR